MVLSTVLWSLKNFLNHMACMPLVPIIWPILEKLPRYNLSIRIGLASIPLSIISGIAFTFIAFPKNLRNVRVNIFIAMKTGIDNLFNNR